jgi:hypothetical protein
MDGLATIFSNFEIALNRSFEVTKKIEVSEVKI